MGFTTVPDVATGDVFTEAMWDTYVKDNFNTGVPVVLADTTLASPAANIVLASIPGDWAHLMVEVYLRCEQAITITGAAWRFNADATASYDIQYMQGGAGTAAAGEAFAQTHDNALSVFCPGTSATANVFAASTIYIPDYADTTKNKMAIVESGAKWGTTTGTLLTRQSVVAWRNNAAITRMEFFNLSVANLSAGSRVTLYGMP